MKFLNLLVRNATKRPSLQTTGWLLAAALLMVRLLPMTLRPGMAVDGGTYATIARNMAAGVGDLWHPVFFAEADAPRSLSRVELKSVTPWNAARDPANGRLDYRIESARPFYDHPPLAFWLESLFFRALGDHFWVEKFYSAMMAVGTALVIAATWRLLLLPRVPLLACPAVEPACAASTAGQASSGTHQTGQASSGTHQIAPVGLRECSWLPVVLWLAAPHWTWMYNNNMLENTLGLFAAIGVYAALRAAEGRLPAALAWTALAAAATAGAVLSKGPFGLFPLAAPLGIALCLQRRRIGRNLALGGLLLLFFGLAMGLVLLNPAAREYLSTYYHVQVVASLSGQREIFHTTFTHVFILFEIAGQMGLPLVIAGGLIWWARRRRGNLVEGLACNDRVPLLACPAVDTAHEASTAGQASSGTQLGCSGRSTSLFDARTGWKPVLRGPLLFCLWIAASASLPIMISPKQMGSYSAPSYPFYALALAVWCGPAVVELMALGSSAAEVVVGHRRLRAIALAQMAVVAVLCCLFAGVPAREREVLHDTLALGRLAPRGTYMSATHDLRDDTMLVSYLGRWVDLGLDSGATPREYCLAPLHAPAPPGYAPVPTDLVRYQLFHRADNASDRTAQRAGANPR